MAYTLKLGFKHRVILLFFILIVVAMLYITSVFAVRFFTALIISLFYLYSMFIILLANLFYDDSETREIFPKKIPTVAVVTYAYNHFKGIEDQIKSLLKLKYPIPFNVYLVNDGTMGHVEKNERLKLITLDKKHFIKGQNIKATIMNLAFSKLKEDNILCIDGDSYPDKNALMKMTPLLQGNTAAIVGLITPSNKEKIIERFQVYEYNLNFGMWARGVSIFNSLFVVFGPLNLIDRKKFLEVGGFDVYNITEDSDIAYKFQKFGYNIKYTKEATAKTDVPPTIKKLWRQRVRWYRGNFYTLVRYSSFFFNWRLKYLGMFVMPYFLFINLLGIAVILRFLFEVVRAFLLHMYFYISEFIAQKAVYFNLFNFNYFYIPPATFMWVISLTIFMFFVIVGFSYTGFKLGWKDTLPFILFYFLYFPIIVVIYIYCLIVEFIGVKYKW